MRTTPFQEYAESVASERGLSRCLLAAMFALAVGALVLHSSSCGGKCSEDPLVRINFSLPLRGSYSMLLLLGKRSFVFPCSTNPDPPSIGDGVTVDCASEALNIHVEGLDLAATSQATLTIQNADGSFVVENLVVALGPVQEGYPNGESRVCARIGTATL
jgi:hypothetical protein